MNHRKRKLLNHDENAKRLLQPLTPRQKRPPPLLAVRSSAIPTPPSTTSPPEAPNSPVKDAYELGEVLFGILKNIQVLLKWELKTAELVSSQAQTVVQYGEELRELTLDFNPEYCLVKTSNGSSVGVLEARALKTLGPLAQDSPITYKASILESEWQDSVLSIASHIRKGKPISIRVDVIGPRHKAEEVSRTLGRAMLFLQSPSGWGVLPYENPQCLDLPLPVPREVPQDQNLPLLHSHRDIEMGNCELVAQGDKVEEDDMSDPIRILNGINQDQLSGVVDIDPRITTNLHPYQKKGVEFISRRESGQLLPDQTLWEPLNPDQQTVGYRHAITGAKSRTEDDGAGGILADDMGLGKTLMMIAAILGSKAHAEEYMNQKISGSADNLRGETDRPIVSTKATLIVVISELLLSNWIKQIETHTTPGTIKWYKYHGKERTHDASLFCNYDIVITTYGTIAADFRKRRGVLNGTWWYRCVLDEAHTIRNWSTKQFNAVNDIPAHIRWCMTGTPIQNGLEDLGSLVRFLRVPILDDIGTFRRHICAAAGSPALKQNLPNLQLLLRSICIQRTQALLGLQSSTEVLRLEFLDQERNEYLAMQADCKRAIAMAVSSNSKVSHHHNILVKLLRLREYCDGIKVTSSNSPDALFSIMEQSGKLCCAYCTVEIAGTDTTEDGNAAQLTECGRFICSDNCCTEQYATETSDSKRGCPFCDVTHKKLNMLSKMEDCGVDQEQRVTYPSKLLRLLEDVKIHMNDEKCIIFSAWKRTLNLVECLFTENGITYCRVDGSISSIGRRKKILFDFQERADMRVLLMTLGTGAVGLNDLSVASRVHLLEPQWNPSVERQAIGRVIRLGQEREVKIIRYIMCGSIEELVEKRQIQKLQLASGGFNLSQLAKDMDMI
ncbi:DNA repair and recombination protein RAD5C [Dactylonectria macrodidyma]|uniref:DNA repair and recombination protein RAD5C n=1 Tax=Dactylonectria macrodidyma TaxID=307937 RepID=A0A9P9FRG3_9HYPO|nr:DNA repair and recombination protein RAD5C [Dactylonectria macrodidyma]